jgi:DNA-binding LacI/PurR family transcriptional regulator
MPKLIDVAKEAGVSVATANQVLNGHTDRFLSGTCEKVKLAAQKIGYRKNIAASGLRNRRSYLVGVLFLNGNYMYLDDFMRGAQDALMDAGLTPLVLTSTDMKEYQRNFDTLLRREIEGLIINTQLENDSSVLPSGFEELSQTGFPMAEIFGNFISTIPSFTLDHYNMAQSVTEQLIEQGCRKIVHVTHDLFPMCEEQPANCWNAWLVWKGYHDTMTAAGLVPTVIRHPLNNYNSAGGSFYCNTQQVVSEVLNLSPDGIFCFNEEQVMAFADCFSQIPAPKIGVIDSERGVFLENYPVIKATRHVYAIGKSTSNYIIDKIKLRGQKT